jgi:hypothetical protein
MRPMEHSTASRQPVPEPTNATETGRTKKAHGERNFEQMILPGLGSGPILPEWVRKRFKRKDTRASHEPRHMGGDRH